MQGDASSLATLIANLLDNALRFTPRGGRVDVGVANDAGRAVLSVIDSGPGIPVAARERVFERFHREAGPDDASRETGSGLGLSIVRRIADAHGATIELADGPDGKGLAVRVRFPKVDTTRLIGAVVLAEAARRLGTRVRRLPLDLGVPRPRSRMRKPGRQASHARHALEPQAA